MPAEGTIRLIARAWFARVAGYERRFGCTIQRALSVRHLADRGTPYAAALAQPGLVAEALAPRWTTPIRTADWRLPAGAFGEAGTVASELGRRLQHAPAEIETFEPLVVGASHNRNSQVFLEIDENQGRYEGREESWFCLMRQVRNHSEWGPRLFEALRSGDSKIPASPRGAQRP